MKFGVALWTTGSSVMIYEQVRKAWEPKKIYCDDIEFISASSDNIVRYCVALCHANLFRMLLFAAELHLRPTVYMSPKKKLTLLFGS